MVMKIEKSDLPMSRIILTLLVLIFASSVSAQDKIAEELKGLANSKQYDKIIKEHAAKSGDYSGKSLYYIGLAYYMKEDDNNCIKFMDRAIEKDPKDPASYYIKTSTLNYMGKFNEAITCFQTAIKLKPGDAEFYSGLGDAYYSLENQPMALDSYKKAVQQENCPVRPYSMIGQIYADLKENDKALEAFYVAKTKSSAKSKSYINALFNIGVLESLNGNYEKAEPAFTELIQLDPADYHSYAKLIQIYYHRKEYDRAKPYKDKLYDAHKKAKLTGNMKDMFCFDQFSWNGYSVQVFERYENENKGKIYYKQIFYLIDQAEKNVLTVQTEFSPVSVEMGGPKYLLCVTKNGNHYNPGIGLGDDIRYDELKAQAIKLFEKNYK
jgi:tetratricopeptide (TPR) repeat protein